MALNSATTFGNDIYRKTAVETRTVQWNYNLSSVFTEWNVSSENNYIYDPSQPLFTDAANGDYSLADRSQAIDKGNNDYAVYPYSSSPLEFDFSGELRIVGGIVDLGAYEWRLDKEETPSMVVTTCFDVVYPKDGLISLREAIIYAGTTLDDGSTFGTTVTFDASLAGKTIFLNVTQLVIDKGITIDASALSRGITIDADQKSRVFYVSGGTEETPVQFKNLTVTGGKITDDAGYYGGGIYLNSGRLTLTNCSVAGNSASAYGGGIYQKGGELTATNCTISGNSATRANL